MDLLRNRRTRIRVEIILLVAVIFIAVVWFVTPYLVRDYINQRLARLPDYVGRVEWVRIHPWTASVDIDNIHLEKKTGRVPVPFFKAPRCHIALQWSEIIHGASRSSVIVFSPQINLVSGPNAAQSQLSISSVWIDTLKQLIPWRINQVSVHDGDVHFRDFQADPQVDLEANHLEIYADNISNSKGLKTPLPAIVKVTAQPLLTGTLEMNLEINFDEKFATFTQNFWMDHVPARGANSALQKYAKTQVKSGEIALYSELTSDKGVYHGYVKPFFYNLEFEPNPADKGNPGAIWSGLLNAVKGLFENDKQVIATQTQVSGRVDQPNVDVLNAIGGILWNAYIEALRPGFDPAHSPPKPADTVTTPKSEATEKEAESLPDKKK